MNTLAITLRTTTVPTTLTHKTRKEEIEELPTYLQVNLAAASGLSLIYLGAQTPPTDYQGLPWLKLDGTGAPIGWYVYAGGTWIAVPDATPPV